MKIRTMSATFLAAVFTLATMSVPVFPADSREISARSKKEERIEGVWDSRVTIINCQTGNPVATFRAMDIFIRGGSLIDTNASPPATRGPGFGTWEHVGGRQFTATFRFFLYNPDGTFAGVRRVTQTIELAQDGNDHTSAVTVEVFDPNDNLVGTACATAIATRVE